MLPVQLVKLALADALYPITFLWAILDGLAGRSVNPVLYPLSGYALIVSLLMQVHIAVGFLALFWRLSRVMRVLHRTVYLTWLVSMLLAAFLAELPPLAVSWTLGVTGCIVSVLYVMAWLRSFCYPLRQEVRAYRMVWLFSLTFVITFGPWILFAGTRLESFAVASFALSGLLNVLVYRCNSRFLGTEWPDMTGATPMQWLGPSSRPVTFDWRFPEVVTVLAEQRDALQESERQIVQLEEQAAGAEQDLDWCSVQLRHEVQRRRGCTDCVAENRMRRWMCECWRDSALLRWALCAVSAACTSQHARASL